LGRCFELRSAANVPQVANVVTRVTCATFVPLCRGAAPVWDLRTAARRLWRAGFSQLPLQDETTQFILINTLDIFVTYLIVATGGVEANPVARAVLVWWGFNGMIGFKMAIVAFVTVVAQVVARRNLATAGLLLRGSTLVVAGVVIYGLVLLARPR
jgi:hypothetical protein